MSKTSQKQIETIANAIIADMQQAGLTPDQMLSVLKMAKQKCDYYNRLKNA